MKATNENRKESDDAEKFTSEVHDPYARSRSPKVKSEIFLQL